MKEKAQSPQPPAYDILPVVTRRKIISPLRTNSINKDEKDQNDADFRRIDSNGSLSLIQDGMNMNNNDESGLDNGNNNSGSTHRFSLVNQRVVSWKISMPSFLGRQESHHSLGQESTQQIDETLGETETALGRILKFIDPIIVALIFINSVMIGIGTLDVIETNDTAREAFEICDRIFLYIFTAEVFLTTTHYLRLDKLQLDAYNPRPWLPLMPPISQREKRSRSKTRPWLIFDLLVIILSWVFHEGSVVRSFRILRALRLISKVKSLQNLMGALLHVIPKMNALLFITCVLLVVFGVMTTIMFKDSYEEGITKIDYFGRLDLTLFTLFQMMTFDNWHEPVREVMTVYPLAWTIFIFWVFISGFVIMNLIVAIVCESLIQLNDTGVRALRGEDIDGEFSIRDRVMTDSIANDAKMSLRLFQLENALKQLLDEELHILEELERIKKQKLS
jgi:hypothetical protein